MRGKIPKREIAARMEAAMRGQAGEKKEEEGGEDIDQKDDKLSSCLSPLY